MLGRNVNFSLTWPWCSFVRKRDDNVCLLFLSSLMKVRNITTCGGWLFTPWLFSNADTAKTMYEIESDSLNLNFHFYLWNKFVYSANHLNVGEHNIGDFVTNRIQFLYIMTCYSVYAYIWGTWIKTRTQQRWIAVLVHVPGITMNVYCHQNAYPNTSQTRSLIPVRLIRSVFFITDSRCALAQYSVDDACVYCLQSRFEWQ